MSNIRVSHNKENPYVILNKTTLEDPNLSWGALGLWAYLLSKPDNWQVSVAHLMKQKIMGRKDYIYKTLKELIDNGYASRIYIREKGRVISSDYTIYETKQEIIQPTIECEPFPEKPFPIKPFPVKPTLISNDSLESNDKKNICASGADAFPFSFPAKKSKKKPDPSLTPDQKQKLVVKYGQALTDKAIQELDEWKESKTQMDPKALELHTDYRRITKWVIPDILKNALAKPMAKKSFQQILSSQFKSGDQYSGYYINFDEWGTNIQSGSGFEVFKAKYSDNGFMEQFENACRKMNIKFVKKSE